MDSEVKVKEFSQNVEIVIPDIISVVEVHTAKSNPFISKFSPKVNKI